MPDWAMKSPLQYKDRNLFSNFKLTEVNFRKLN